MRAISPAAHGKKDCGAIGGELEGVTVSTGNENGSAPLFFGGGCGSEKVISLEARRLRILKAAAPTTRHIELLEQRIVELATTLITKKLLMPIGRNIKRIPGNQHRTRLLLAIKPQ